MAYEAYQSVLMAAKLQQPLFPMTLGQYTSNEEKKGHKLDWTNTAESLLAKKQ